MQVNRIATMTVETVQPSDTIAHVAHRMTVVDAGFMPVVEDGALVGVITDRDIVTRVIAEEKNPTASTVREAMTRPTHWLFEDADHETACRLMMDHGVRRLVVCDHLERPIGVLSIDDLALFGCGDTTVGRVLEHIVAPALIRDVLG